MKLLEACELVVDCPHSTARDEGNGYPLIRTPNVGRGRLKLDGVHRVSYETYCRRNERAVPQTDDLILAREAPVGNVSIIKEGQKVCLGQRTVLIRPNKNIIDPDYLVYYLLSPEIQHVLLNSANGATVSHLNMSDIRKLDIKFPSLEKQKKIGRILSIIEDKIEINNKINDNLQAQARSIYKAWFEQYIPFDGIQPDSWKKGKLKDVLTLKRNAIKAGENTELPYLPIDVIPMNTFALSGVKPNEEAQSSLITFDKDDIVIGAMRVYFHRVIIAPFAGITRTTCFTLSPSEKEYLCFGLLCCDQDSSIEFAQTTSKGSTMPYAIWDGGLGDMDIVIPDKNTAHEFNEIVMPMIRTIQSSYEEIKHLCDLRDGLLPRLMSGEIDVTDIDL